MGGNRSAHSAIYANEWSNNLSWLPNVSSLQKTVFFSFWRKNGSRDMPGLQISDRANPANGKNHSAASKGQLLVAQTLNQEFASTVLAEPLLAF